MLLARAALILFTCGTTARQRGAPADNQLEGRRVNYRINDHLVRCFPAKEDESAAAPDLLLLDGHTEGRRWAWKEQTKSPRSQMDTTVQDLGGDSWAPGVER